MFDSPRKQFNEHYFLITNYDNKIFRTKIIFPHEKSFLDFRLMLATANFAFSKQRLRKICVMEINYKKFHSIEDVLININYL